MTSFICRNELEYRYVSTVDVGMYSLLISYCYSYQLVTMKSCTLHVIRVARHVYRIPNSQADIKITDFRRFKRVCCKDALPSPSLKSP